MQQLTTELQYMGVNIPVTIDNDIDYTSKSPLIAFTKVESTDDTIINVVEDTGCVIINDDSAVDVILSSKFFNGTATKDMRTNVNAAVLAHMKLVFDKIKKFDEFVISIAGSGILILPVLDYITNRYEDFERITIHVDDPLDEHDLFYHVRDYVTSSLLLSTKEKSILVYSGIYGNNPH